MPTVSPWHKLPPTPLTQSQPDAIANTRAYLSSSQDIQASINAKVAPVETAYCEGSPEAYGLAWQLWDAIIAVARSVLHDDAAKTQIRFIRFFGALKARPDPQVPANKLSLAEKSSRIRKTLSYQSFIAMVMLRDTLEVDIEIEELNTHLPAAAVWIFYAGKYLFVNEWDGHATPLQIRREESRWQGPLLKICKERCALWKVRFSELAERAGVADVVKEVALEAHRILAVIEQGGRDRSDNQSCEGKG